MILRGSWRMGICMILRRLEDFDDVMIYGAFGRWE